MLQQQNTVTSGKKIRIVQYSILPFCTQGPLKGSLNTDFFIRAPATDMCHRYLAIPDSGLTRGLSLLQTVTSMKRREAAGKSEGSSDDFLNEIFSPWILETKFGGKMAFRNTKTLAYNLMFFWRCIIVQTFQNTNLVHNSFNIQQYICYITLLNMFRAARCSKHVEECNVTYILLNIKRIVH